MADITITSASVKAGSGAVVTDATSGATISAGEAIYFDSTTGKMLLADANATGAKTCSGIALNSASDGQPIKYQRSGPIAIGGTLAPGTVYAVSATAGAIAPLADITTGDDVIILGVAKSTTVLQLDIQIPGVTL
jgi:hypothetical protein